MSLFHLGGDMQPLRWLVHGRPPVLWSWFHHRRSHCIHPRLTNPQLCSQLIISNFGEIFKSRYLQCWLALMMVFQTLLFYLLNRMRWPIALQIAGRFASTMAWLLRPICIFPISDQAFVDGLYWSTFKVTFRLEIPHNTSSLWTLWTSSHPPVTTTCRFKLAALRPYSVLGKLLL